MLSIIIKVASKAPFMHFVSNLYYLRACYNDLHQYDVRQGTTVNTQNNN